ncbi:MAG: EscJ/YscJ/HrcJ family type III secretion inner membrane ring protein [Mesorhizobium sp.]|uniref:type III secretion system inner membrane ring lipoprotein SctJ n=3 Tax=Phyllobacteriaceae TaxID=69277 RepID=UPI000494C9B5|nr:MULTISPECIES: type III secretion inner membrane ring lipoprotein SctJ [Mesorhizobium]MCP9233471.1 type III secretion inner membrane ring lipoprotein SctJ [Mesorhizobium sp. LMG 17147]RUU45351.1 EscJ/YscJ/HrcJ family type III secretion inner membrane ring protein [Mesorhizobium sp. M6A.T.Ce.TU.002.03.1.1]RWB27337.1 MAG: EscJ/YscJ/HrcJ family type III secretion inner membrane ring protein [Mesorhizobium sp.]RWC97775.1 MAG: EscJ/YscJ/HrcJ family type III secretion inner membrane ring protein [M
MIGLAEGEIMRGLSGWRSVRLVMLPVLVALSACKTDLYTQLQEREANEMLALLEDNGVAAIRVVAKDGTSTIQVDEKLLAFSINLLNAKGLPRQSFKNLGEIFQGSGLIASPTEERARYVYALSEELSRTISDIDGVFSVRVHVVLPHNDLVRAGATPSSAAVFIRHDAKTNVAALLPKIKMLVADSIEGLSYDKVEVVLVPVERSAHEQRPDPTAVLPQASTPLPAPILATVTGFAAAVFAVACYLLVSVATRRRKQSTGVSKVEGRRDASAVEAIRKRMPAIGRG